MKLIDILDAILTSLENQRIERKKRSEGRVKAINVKNFYENCCLFKGKALPLDMH